jgi:hypothetical protein
MFDYVSAEEIRLLYKLQTPGLHPDLRSNHRVRLELLGLISDGPGGVKLTAKGARVATTPLVGAEWHEFETQIVRLPSK